MLIAAQSPFTNALRNAAELLGRVLLALLFLVAGLGKVAAYSATVSYMAANGAGRAVAAGRPDRGRWHIAIISGWNTRIASILLARFSLLAALLFHHNFADQVQTLMFLKDFSIAGAFLILAARGSGRFGLDTRILA